VPQGTTIAADGYLTIWADEDEDQEGLHASFKLSGSGEAVLLVNADTIVVDAIDYPEQTTDVSYSRFPNGTGDFRFLNPTFNSENNTTSTTEIYLEIQDVNFHPNPSEGYFYLEYSNKSVSNENLVIIHNVTGTMIYNERVGNQTLISTEGWSPGIYVISSEGAFLKLMVL